MQSRACICERHDCLSRWRGVVEAVEAYDMVLSKTPKDTRARLLRGVCGPFTPRPCGGRPTEPATFAGLHYVASGKAHAEQQNTESALLDFDAGIDELKDKAKGSTNGAVLNSDCV